MTSRLLLPVRRLCLVVETAGPCHSHRTAVSAAAASSSGAPPPAPRPVRKRRRARADVPAVPRTIVVKAWTDPS